MPAASAALPGMHLADLGRRERLAVGHEQQRQHDDREHEIGHRSGRDDRGALAQPLVMERDLALGGGQLPEPATGRPEVASASPNILT